MFIARVLSLRWDLVMKNPSEYMTMPAEQQHLFLPLQDLTNAVVEETVIPSRCNRFRS